MDIGNCQGGPSRGRSHWDSSLGILSWLELQSASVSGALALFLPPSWRRSCYATRRLLAQQAGTTADTLRNCLLARHTAAESGISRNERQWHPASAPNPQSASLDSEVGRFEPRQGLGREQTGSSPPLDTHQTAGCHVRCRKSPPLPTLISPTAPERPQNQECQGQCQNPTTHSAPPLSCVGLILPAPGTLLNLFCHHHELHPLLDAYLHPMREYCKCLAIRPSSCTTWTRPRPQPTIAALSSMLVREMMASLDDDGQLELCVRINISCIDHHHRPSDGQCHMMPLWL